MQSRLLDRRIIIQEVTETQNSYGAASESWSTFKTVWAEVKPVKGKEFFLDEQVNARIDSIFRIRWIEGLTTKMRISYNGQYYNIYSIIELGRQDGLQINAYTEVV